MNAMKTNMKKLQILAIAMFLITSLSAQTANDIITNYVNAIGGQEKLSNIKSLYTES